MESNNQAEKEKAQQESNLLDLCPKLAPRWAKTYVNLWKTASPDAAKIWGKVFLEGDKRNMALLSEHATKELRKRGLIPKEPQDPSAA